MKLSSLIPQDDHYYFATSMLVVISVFATLCAVCVFMMGDVGFWALLGYLIAMGIYAFTVVTIMARRGQPNMDRVPRNYASTVCLMISILWLLLTVAALPKLLLL
ncbi:MAG: hypothetical protein H6684_05345 [Deltaproteobacteria bacterium]|nr:hypothetical protein [Deltaproteobacteria bacterium]MCB9479073.1 hypothetical protein [Deltaproteobacteria bacterium]MCB9488135.1 hypothetical protein [Deltaproteobacteria bacterium]